MGYCSLCWSTKLTFWHFITYVFRSIINQACNTRLVICYFVFDSTIVAQCNYRITFQREDLWIQVTPVRQTQQNKTTFLCNKSYIACPEFQTGVPAVRSPLSWHGSRPNYWFSKRLTDRGTLAVGIPASYSGDPEFEPKHTQLAVLSRAYKNLNVAPPSNLGTATGYQRGQNLSIQ